ncbi:crotonobetainyl-CoA dehydrogenase [Citrobacter amalonaticus]|nr:crotonobetainyl-CoA dehydrogenase [Citrobacter amalonaticus]
MDFNFNDEQELFVAGIRELMASENWKPILPNAIATACIRSVS